MSAYRWNSNEFVDEFNKLGVDHILMSNKLVVSHYYENNSGRTGVKGHKECINYGKIYNDIKKDGSRSGKECERQSLVKCLVCFDEMDRTRMYGNSSCDHYL